MAMVFPFHHQGIGCLNAGKCHGQDLNPGFLTPRSSQMHLIISPPHQSSPNVSDLQATFGISPCLYIVCTVYIYLFASTVYFTFSLKQIRFEVYERRKRVCGSGCRDYLRASSGKLFPAPGWAFESLSPSKTVCALSLPSPPLSFRSDCAFIHSRLHPCKSISTGVPAFCLSHLDRSPAYGFSVTASPAPAHPPPTAVQKKTIQTLVNGGKRSPTLFLFVTGVARASGTSCPSCFMGKLNVSKDSKKVRLYLTGSRWVVKCLARVQHSAGVSQNAIRVKTLKRVSTSR